jgi:hypothetical protein
MNLKPQKPPFSVLINWRLLRKKSGKRVKKTRVLPKDSNWLRRKRNPEDIVDNMRKHLLTPVVFTVVRWKRDAKEIEKRETKALSSPPKMTEKAETHLQVAGRDIVTTDGTGIGTGTETGIGTDATDTTMGPQAREAAETESEIGKWRHLGRETIRISKLILSQLLSFYD